MGMGVGPEILCRKFSHIKAAITVHMHMASVFGCGIVESKMKGMQTDQTLWGGLKLQ